MFRRILFGFLWCIPSYLAGAGIGIVLVSLFSANKFDVSVEAVMTAAFVTGPFFALIGFILGVVMTKRKPPSKPAEN
jgi:hypothetical protein